MKLRLRKTQRKKNNRKKSFKRQNGGNNLIVKYDGIVVQGQKLTKQQTAFEPSITFTSIPGKLYTLAMWDPDVPSQNQPGWVHWISINLRNSNNISSNRLLEYTGPSPPYGTHRYFFGLFTQNERITPEQPKRANFNILDFVKQNNLVEVSKVFMIVSA